MANHDRLPVYRSICVLVLGCMLITAGCNRAAETGTKPPVTQIRGGQPGSANSDGQAGNTAVASVGDMQGKTLPLPGETTPELIGFIREMNSREPAGETQDEKFADMAVSRRSIIVAADKLLSQQGLDQEARNFALSEKGKSLGQLERLEVAGAAERFEQFVIEMQQDKDPEIAKAGRVQMIVIRLRQLMEGKTVNGQKVDPQEIVSGIERMLQDEGRGGGELEIASKIASRLESMEYYKPAETIYASIGKAFANNADSQVAAEATQMAAAAQRRLGLLGQPVSVQGTDLDGKPFDIAAWQGKVVLIDFWATWCPPCIAELPNVVENYKKYHDRGFEVVGISLDEEKDELVSFLNAKNLPWTTLFNPETDEKKRGFNGPLPEQFGVQGIPATYLVDQSGKVVAIGVRGEKLGEELAKLLGDSKTGE